jgi:sulfatase modifying factor 1
MEQPSKLTRLIIAILFALALSLGFHLIQHIVKRPPARPRPAILFSNGKNAPKGMVWLPGGEFMMGSNSHLAKHNEMPAHPVNINGFWVDQNL